MADTMLIPLAAGGIAGTSVDVVLFPLDTIKTRLQSKEGLKISGGFRGIYSGILPAAAGSAPSAATFFLVYEGMKKLLLSSSQYSHPAFAPAVHMVAASCGEVASCLIRVPFEITKQRMQANQELKALQVVRHALRTEGFRGLYRGFFSTIIREIPFSALQYPLWEFFKSKWSEKQNKPTEPWQSAVCGALSGGIAAFLTTPLDVVKTRIMLADKSSEEATAGYVKVIKKIWLEEGSHGLLAGVFPRVLWISFGGFVFLGAYAKATSIFEQWMR